MTEFSFYLSIILSIFGFCILCNIALCVCFKNPYNVVRKYRLQRRKKAFMGKFSNVVEIDYNNSPYSEIRLQSYTDV